LASLDAAQHASRSRARRRCSSAAATTSSALR